MGPRDVDSGHLHELRYCIYIRRNREQEKKFMEWNGRECEVWAGPDAMGRIEEWGMECEKREEGVDDLELW